MDGAILEEHSKRKHKILREYIYDYVMVRCRIPRAEKFRFAIIDGFAGGGRYEDGSPGSPLIFLEEVKRAVLTVNIERVANGYSAIDVDFLLILNDTNRGAIEILKANVAAMQLDVAGTCRNLRLRVEYLSKPFELAYLDIKRMLSNERFGNVLFNLDQCGDTHVRRQTILNIMNEYKSVEIFLTFMVTSLLAYLKKDEPEDLTRRLSSLEIDGYDLSPPDHTMSKNEWLGRAEREIFDTFKGCAPYVSPFSINNPSGWRYWLIHFAKLWRARQVYNNILHRNATLQAHFGRSGLNMLAYNQDEGQGSLYLFNVDGRESAKQQLMDDIPHFIDKMGDIVPVQKFYEQIYNDTPAHAEDINAALIENPDLEVITIEGRGRRSPNTIKIHDTIRLKKQRSLFIFSNHKKKR
jgi:three-Cys-motif partner protein